MVTEYSPVGSIELEQLSPHEELFELAKSNALASYKLCQLILDGSYDNTFTNSLVIRSLSYHSYELFLKGAILYKSEEIYKKCITHRADKLRNKFDELYPEDSNNLPRLFNVYNFTNDKELSEKAYETFDQFFRYTRDLKLKSWIGGGSFSALLYVTELSEFISIMNDIISKIQSQNKIKYYPVLVFKDEKSSWAVSFVDIPIHIVDSCLKDAFAKCQEAFEEFMQDEESLPSPSSMLTVVTSVEGRNATRVGVATIDTSFFYSPPNAQEDQ